MEEARGPDFDKLDPPSRTLATFKSGNGPSGSGWLGTGQQRPGSTPPPFELAVLAGGCASAAVDVAIYPIDTLKTRLQAPQGFRAAGGYTGLFRGVLAAAGGAVPGGAIFFGSYEYTRSSLPQGLSGSWTWPLDALAACAAAAASCLVRTPAMVVQQRMQVGQFTTVLAAVRGVSREGNGAFYSGLGISIAREIPFAFIQFPIYEGLKRLWPGGGELTPSQGALCGSVAGAAAAAATTPLDVLKTRQMLGHSRGGVVSEVRHIMQTEGAHTLLRGLGPRVGWMALGGYIFFGAYEQTLRVLLGLRQQDDAQHAGSAGVSPPAAPLLPVASLPSIAPSAAAQERASDAPLPALVALLSGGLAGLVIDVALYPIDTLKTRAIQGLGTVSTLSEVGLLWSGIGAAMLPAIPSAAVFFVTYEGVKAQLGTAGNGSGSSGSGGNSFAHWCIAAATAEGASCVVRVPAELLKMTLQSGQATTFSEAVASAWRHGGILGFYRGLGATLCLDLPFALLQFPLYEYLKAELTQMRRRHGLATLPVAADGAITGAVAGATAAFCTTPLDVVRTRHVLWQGERRALSETLATIFHQEGIAGFWRGVLPRTVYMGLGGTLYLGTYSYCSTVLLPMLAPATEPPMSW